MSFNGRFGDRFGFRRFHRFRDRGFFFDDCFGCRSRFFFDPFFFDSGLFFGSPFFPSFFPSFPGFYGGGFYGDYYGPPAPQQEPVVTNSDNGASAQLAAEVQRLTDEVEDLRSEESRRYSDDRARAASSGASITAKEPAAATVFVFLDGRRISTKSYAIAGQTLWIFTEQSARKYQISALDMKATEQVNAANGVEFHLPEAPAHQ